ncbi:uncharacterized protein LOC128246165 [Mya arenaria]|uniref:uncharacterized protein LOC128202790 n=2 Tax=Mya arenaria TaxID=6604 RepID=UPI0022DEC30E|nr:uncharacterized protein LOC128202790 [Mya arenaria]XP_052759898.1 uncharacterized protein LOC128202799 [Mya arenaria]XP_052761924.1 uncharacterized protein LOC128204555 [Mya arenaria]XP_052766840.1 uncharacterized protein LOC128207753 [Mya arenaria]XP_052771352.1 uncharacterized protein LOC128211014 [Mya arenaria]XP_052772640.1 uncharacterized protein LOC128211674 [Mya arenaria]XP_052774046.1 uncharacterized protein LOC128212779 [Mya arenaria]XP_052777952.1 uncharacterized protein LOC1282
MADVDNEITGACMNNNELTPFKVVDLKRYLANRKLNVSGLKCELIERIKGAYRLSITDKRVLEERDREERERRATERFILPCGEGLPPPSTLKAWKSTIDLFPAVEEKDIYNYIVLKRDSKRQLKARTYYVDGHVQKVEVHLISEECSHCYVQASVLPSFPTADKRKSPEYQPWILLSKVTGCIHSAFCNCPAGEGECCNHIGALLYGLEDLTRKKTLAPTSKPCAWNNFSMLSAPRKRKLSPRKSEDLMFSKKKLYNVSVRKVSVNKNHELNSINGCTVNIDRFRQKLVGSKLNVGWLKNFEIETTENEPDLPVLHSVPFNYHDSVNLRDSSSKTVFLDHFDSLKQSAEEIQLTEILTRGQKSGKWQEARKERLTASNFGSICRRKESTEPDGLLRQMLYSNFTSKYTEYGIKHEKAAKRMYAKAMQTDHKGLAVKDSGLVVCADRPYLGASPDGLVFCSHCTESVGLVEIKCPASKKWRMQTPEECCEDNDFFCQLENGKVLLKETHKYYYQVQGQMGITGRKWCDFVVWTCVGLSIQRIAFCESFWLKMLCQLDRFCLESYIPELYAQRVKRGMSLFN